MSKNVNSSITATQLIIFLFIFSLFIFIGFMIDDNNLKISYMLTVILIMFTGFNLNMTINYYRKLRNEVGKPGPRGVKGEDGPKGDPGVCVFKEKCGIKNCEDKVYDKIAETNYYGSQFDIECLKNPETCSNEELKESAKPINELIKTQIEICKKSKEPEEILMKQLFPDIKN